MKLTYISTYPPRACGLATFNRSLINAINTNLGQNHPGETVVALNTESVDEYAYPDEVRFVIRQQVLEDYSRAANFINNSDTDACILQHEFGIYGGDDGAYVLSLVNQVEKPLVSIFHTVLERPSYQQKVILQTIARKSDKVVVMGKKAIDMLITIYGVNRNKISYIEHGAPDIEASVNNPVKSDALLSDRKTLLTFGLLSRNKGLETVIRALPKIAERHPDVLYVILGATHPDIVKRSGEEYRDSLMAMAEKLGVGDNVTFLNSFVTEDDLMNYLSATDIYVSPYLNEAQITSGTLAYAIGAGAAVVATPYWHAKEILANGRGRLFDFKDNEGLANIINELLDSPVALNSIKQSAYKYGLNLRWPVIGKNYIDIINDVVENPDLGERIFCRIIDPEIMPEFRLDYVKYLTNHIGIIQHAKFGVPNWKEGYCIDDNARALLMTLMANRLGYSEATDLMSAYMSFMLYMQNDGGYFRNFLSYKHEYLDKMGSEDAFGRSIWALGYLVCYAPDSAGSRFGEELFRKASPNFKNLTHIRGIANTIIGISYYLKAYHSDIDMIGTLHHLTNRLIEAYDKCRCSKWQWFEDYLTYDNAILPLALLHSAEITRDQKTLDVAFESIRFLEKVTITSKYFTPVGNNGWYSRDGEMPSFDQQAIDTMAMTLLYAQYYRMTGDPQCLKKLFFVYSWFLGENSLNMPLYDPETKGCYDGLHPNGINQNQGAESTLAYLISHLAVLATLKNDTAETYTETEMEAILSK
jgi:glycosyltransferase involved in cell wall biosynthesis